MKKTILPVLVWALLFSCRTEEIPEQAEQPVEASAAQQGIYIPGTAIVEFSDEMVALLENDLKEGTLRTRSSDLNHVVDAIGITSMKRLFPEAGEYEPRTRREGLHKWYVIEYDESRPRTRAENELMGIPGVEYVEGRRKTRSLEFNDPGLSRQWAIDNSTTPGFDINVLPVWAGYTTGRQDVIVAVVDQGVDASHPDLAANCLKDGNFNFVTGGGTIVPGAHGTHVAGVIAAINNNGEGICGIAGGDAAKGQSGVRILSCQMLMTVGEGSQTVSSSGNSAAAIKWGADHGAVISQNSWGYDFDTNGDGRIEGIELETELHARISRSDSLAVDYFIKYAGCDNNGAQLPDSPMKGGIVFFAAGNDNVANSAPSNAENVIAVGAADKFGNKANYSNYGSWVDLAAPGSGVYSTVLNGGYANMNGTSMACPQVSGVAALVVSYLGGRDFTCEMLRERLLEGAREGAVKSNYPVGRLVDALGALSYGHTMAPSSVPDLSCSVVSNRIDFQWSIPGDGAGRPAYGYVMLYGKDKDAVESADPAHPGEGVLSEKIVRHGAVGDAVRHRIEGLDFSTEYHVALAAYSYNNLFSDKSAVRTIVTGVNNPPAITTTYSGTHELKAFETLTVPFSVEDPDGHAFTLTYRKGSDADSLHLDDSDIVITGNRAESGSYTLVLTATDRYGASSSFEFPYTILVNNPPKANVAIEDIFMNSPGESRQFNLSDLFTDADHEPLQYKVETTNTGVAHPNITSGILYITALQFGHSVLRVTATDARGDKAEISFRILVREAGIDYLAYPNPVLSDLNIATGEKRTDTEIRIVSQTGAVVLEEKFQASAFEPKAVDMSRCAPGRYLMILKFDSKEYKKQIVKK